MSKYKKKQQAQQRQDASAAVLVPKSTSTPTPTPAIRESQATTKPRSMDQDRAEYALAKIDAIANGDDARQAEVRRYLNGLPALIRMNGLGQALAFYHMKDEGSAHRQIYHLVGEWLCADTSKGRVFKEDPDVLKAITRSDIQHYMAAQNEALVLLEWLKKFALAFLKKE